MVIEGQDGYLGVNYIELVPILIRSIQELKAELDEVRGNYSDKSLSRGATTDVTSAASSSNILYQNTPNPFKEQTVIRFSLAANARDASICIFDMTGKMLKKMPISSGETSVTVSGWELGEGMFLYSHNNIWSIKYFSILTQCILCSSRYLFIDWKNVFQV